MNRIALISPLPQGHRAKFWEDYFNRLKAKEAIKPDTQISVRTINKHTSKGRISANSLYFELLQRQYTVEAVLDAQKDGFDAVIDSCYFDPALDEAREVADIPVVGLAEASFSYSLLLGRKKGSTAVIAVAEKGISKTWDVLDKYGFNSHLIANRPVRQVPEEAYFGAVASGDPAKLKAAKDAFIKVARECIADEAELVIIGCGGLGPMMEAQGVFYVDDVPIVNCVTCAFMMAEDLIALRKLGVSVSRRLMYRKPLEEDWQTERKNFGFA